MKTIIDKSEIFKSAYRDYKLRGCGIYTWSDCLKEAWRREKIRAMQEYREKNCGDTGAELSLYTMFMLKHQKEMRGRNLVFMNKIY